MKYALLLATLITTPVLSKGSSLCQKFNGKPLLLKKLGSKEKDLFCWIKTGKSEDYFDGFLIDPVHLKKIAEPTKSLAQQAFFKSVAYDRRQGHQAQNYCNQLNGEAWDYQVVFNGKKIGPTGLCRFSDGSMIGLWKLYSHSYKFRDLYKKYSLRQSK